MNRRNDDPPNPTTSDAEDHVEMRLASARQKLREAEHRLTTREHAIINSKKPPPDPTDEDDTPTQPNIRSTR